MTLSTDYLFITDEQDGFRECRDNRTTSANSMTVLYCSQGYIDVWYHDAMIRINAGDLFVRIPDFCQALGPYKMSPDFAFKQVTLDAKVYERVMYDHMRIEPDWFAKSEYIKEHPIFPINAPSKEFFYAYYDLITLQMQDRQTEYRKQILMLIAKGATMEMLNYLDKLAVVDHAKYGTRRAVNTSDYTFTEFTRLLQLYPHKREVQWYANELGITPKYLSEICKERSGKSASEWIADITMSELKHYLQDTVLPIRQVAELMDFPNASFFCQYTKKHTGMTPNKYRRNRQNL